MNNLTKYYLIMTRIQFSILLGLYLSTSMLSNCQSTEGNKPKTGASLEEQATVFVKTIVAFDFKASADYFLPEFMESMGGREATIQIYADGAKQFMEGGTKLSGGKVDNASAISKCNGTFQCVLRQEVVMESIYPSSEPETLHSNLIAVSRDEGQTWKFLLAGEDELPTLRQKFPFLCEDLVLQKY
jgi:hypothetical protein